MFSFLAISNVKTQEEEEDGDEGVGSSSRQGKGKKRMAVRTADMLDARKFLKVSDTIRVGVNHGENEIVLAVRESLCTK